MRAERNQRQENHLHRVRFDGHADRTLGHFARFPAAFCHDGSRELGELDAVAEACVGGVPVAGGGGKVFGAIIGALVMASLTNGMNLMGIGISRQYIVRALALAAAVNFDVTTPRRAK